MRIFSTLFFIVISNVLFGQLSGSIGIGYNRFANNYNDYKRTNGLTLQFCLEKRITDLFSLNYGMNVSVAHENYIDYYFARTLDNQTGIFMPDYSTIITIKSNNYSLSFQYPIVLVTEVISDRLYILSGISLNLDNFIVLGDEFVEIDPESSYPLSPNDYYTHDWPKGGLGFGHQIGLLYKPTKNLGIYGEWKTTQNKTFGFSYLEIGIKYRIFTNR